MSQNAPAEAGQPKQDHAQHGFRRKMVGQASSSAKMQKTVVVEVVRTRRDPLYGKYVRSRDALQGARREEPVQGRRPGRDSGAPPDQPREALGRGRAFMKKAVEE